MYTEKNVWQAVISMQEIETGNFSPPRLVLIPPDFIRVVNWNINRGLRLQKVIEFLASAKADVFLLQESDLNARRTHHLNVAKEIAQKLRMNYVFGREFQELTQGSRASPAYHGQATLARWRYQIPVSYDFQKQSNFWRPRWFLPEIEPFQERIGGRLALVCESTIAGKRVVTYNLHLESKGDDALRCSQIEETLEDARRYDGEHADCARWRLQSRRIRGAGRCRDRPRAVSGRVCKSARANNTSLVLRAGEGHRLDLYAGPRSGEPSPGPSLSLGF